MAPGRDPECVAASHEPSEERGIYPAGTCEVQAREKSPGALEAPGFLRTKVRIPSAAPGLNSVFELLALSFP